MKIFWSIVVVLTVVALTFALMPSSEARQEPAATTSLSLPPTEPALPDVIPPSPTTSDQESDLQQDALDSLASDMESKSTSDETQAGPSGADALASSEGEGEANQDPSTEAAPEVVEHETFGQIVASRYEELDDGWLLYDGRFKVRGSGTEADPYEVPWEMLMSASETYQPRRGKKKLPERITMLHERHVRVTGYVAFPIVAAQQNELLAMRNMWDGCCVGLPPTAYDAVEVRLAQAATGDERFTAFGTVEGYFKVDPYVRGNWLLGLYLMEDAKLTPSGDMRSDPSQHGGAGAPGGMPTDLPGGLP